MRCTEDQPDILHRLKQPKQPGRATPRARLRFRRRRPTRFRPSNPSLPYSASALCFQVSESGERVITTDFRAAEFRPDRSDPGAGADRAPCMAKGLRRLPVASLAALPRPIRPAPPRVGVRPGAGRRLGQRHCRRSRPPADGDSSMTAAMAIPGNPADTFPVHFFGGAPAFTRDGEFRIHGRGGSETANLSAGTWVGMAVTDDGGEDCGMESMRTSASPASAQVAPQPRIAVRAPSVCGTPALAIVHELPDQHETQQRAAEPGHRAKRHALPCCLPDVLPRPPHPVTVGQPGAGDGFNGAVRVEASADHNVGDRELGRGLPNHARWCRAPARPRRQVSPSRRRPPARR